MFSSFPLNTLSSHSWLYRTRTSWRKPASEVSAPPSHEVASLVRERAILLRRMETLARSKKLFEAWHVFHKPLVYVMFLIAMVHLLVAFYMGYADLHF